MKLVTGHVNILHTNVSLIPHTLTKKQLCDNVTLQIGHVSVWTSYTVFVCYKLECFVVDLPLKLIAFVHPGYLS